MGLSEVIPLNVRQAEVLGAQANDLSWPIRLSLGRSRSVDGAQTVPMLYGHGLRHTLASHGCCSRGNPVGR